MIELSIERVMSMTKERRNALMTLAIALIFSAIQLSRSPQDITTYRKVLSLALPFVAIIFALSEKNALLRWSLVVIETLLFFIMLFIALHT